MAKEKVDVKVTEVDKNKDKEIEKFLNQKPTRKEVGDFLSNIIDQQVVPRLIDEIQKASNMNRIAVLALQALLVQKSVITTDELQGVISNILEEIKKEVEENKEKLEKEKAEDNSSPNEDSSVVSASTETKVI